MIAGAPTKTGSDAIRIIKGLELRPEGRSIESAQDAGFTVCLLLVGTGKATDRSARLHNSAYERMGSRFIYLTSDTADINGAIDEVRRRSIRGASVGIPYKREVMPLLDHVDRTAEDIGAVNTVVNEGGRLYGYNSDWMGAVRAIEEKAQLRRGMRAILVGAGGAGRAIAFALRRKGVGVRIFDRAREKAEALAGEMGLEFGGALAGLEVAKPCDVIINATPIGSRASGHEGESVVPMALLDRMEKGSIAFDAVYLPYRTRFLDDAEKRGLVVVEGAGMLLHQAAFQVTAFTGKAAPVDTMRRALMASLTDGRFSG